MTIFAPTDDAFDQLPRQAVDELFNDPNALVDLLTKHVVKSTLLSPSLTFKELETAGGQSINVKVRRGRVFIEDARLIDGKNGVCVAVGENCWRRLIKKNVDPKSIKVRKKNSN